MNRMRLLALNLRLSPGLWRRFVVAAGQVTLKPRPDRHKSNTHQVRECTTTGSRAEKGDLTSPSSSRSPIRSRPTCRGCMRFLKPKGSKSGIANLKTGGNVDQYTVLRNSHIELAHSLVGGGTELDRARKIVGTARSIQDRIERGDLLPGADRI